MEASDDHRGLAQLSPKNAHTHTYACEQMFSIRCSTAAIATAPNTLKAQSAPEALFSPRDESRIDGCVGCVGGGAAARKHVPTITESFWLL